ncbi:MAG: hypothetical protein MHPSP_000690 [Paramarteilia canceri]
MEILLSCEKNLQKDKEILEFKKNNINFLNGSTDLNLDNSNHTNVEDLLNEFISHENRSDDKITIEDHLKNLEIITDSMTI